MDELRRHAAAPVDRWQRLARGQRIAIVAVLVASAVGFLFLLSHSAESWQPIAEGREFSASELDTIQYAWRKAGLNSFRRDARKLLVPSADMARYTAALPKSQRADSDSGDERGPSIAKANLFTSHEQLEQIKDNDLRNTLRRHLKAIPAIADADVIWARGKGRSAFASRSKVTATINVLPRDGHDITLELAQSLRTAVAGMIADLSAEDIVVLDQSTGLTMTDDSEPVIVEQQRHRQQERLARQLESRIAASLAHIPHATVQAKLVEVPRPTNRPTTSKPTFESAIVWITDASDNFVEFSPLIAADSDTPSNSTDTATSFAWHIVVQIPQAFFDAHVAQQLLSNEHRATNHDDLRLRLRRRIRLLVRNLLPPDATLAELSIVPRTVTTVATPPAVAFAAWPHVACGFLAVLCLAVAARRRAADVNPPSERSMDRTLQNAKPLGGLPPSARQLGEDLAVIAPSIPTQPPTDLARLQQLDPQPLADALRHERPQAIAVLLTRFSTRLASACLSQFAASLQTDVIRRLKSLGEVPEELVAEIAHAVCEHMTPAAESISHEPTNRIVHLLPESPTQRAFA